MLSSYSAELRLIDPALLLECVVPRMQSQIAKLLETDGVHMLVIFSCTEENRYEYLEVGPGRRVRQLDEALVIHPSGYRAQFIVPAKACPESVLSSGISAAQSIPYALAKLVPMAPLPASKATGKIALVNAAPAGEHVAPSSAPVVATVVKRPPVTEETAPAATPSSAPVSFEPLPEENPADTLRRALHGVLASITDREASLSVREGSTAERLELFSSREREIEAGQKALATREAAIAAREAAVGELEKGAVTRDGLIATREKALADSEEDFKTRKNSVAFREKSLATREQEMEARLFDVNAREGALVAIEKALASRDVVMSAKEKELLSREDAFVAERSRIDGEIRAFSDELKAREAALVAREKTLTSREATFKAETVALLQTLENITTTSRASTLGAGR
jgi:hypothetical protein